MKHALRAPALELLLWGITAIALVAAVVGWQQAGETASAPAALSLTPPAGSPRWSADSLAAAANDVAAHDPFRVDRRPADVPYHAVSDGAPPPAPPPAPPKPNLTVAGLVGGPPWAALLDGIPGRAGSVVVHAGDVIDDLTVRAVGKDTVIVSGMDTTWTLLLKHPWR